MRWLVRAVVSRLLDRLATPCYVLLAVVVLDQLAHVLCYVPWTVVAVAAARAKLMEAAVLALLVLLCYVLLEEVVLDRPVCSICYLPLAVALAMVSDRLALLICYVLQVLEAP